MDIYYHHLNLDYVDHILKRFQCSVNSSQFSSFIRFIKVNLYIHIVTKLDPVRNTIIHIAKNGGW